MTAREQFLEEKGSCVGGSDIPKIAGFSPYGSAVDVYQEKVNGIQSEQTDVMLRGIELERPLLLAYMLEDPQHLRPVRITPEFVRHPAKPWAGVHLDAISQDATRLIEAKTTTNRDAWENGVRLDYLLQVQFQLGVTGLAGADVVVSIANEGVFNILRDIRNVVKDGDLAQILLARTDYRVYRVERDEEMIDAAFATAENFWLEHVEKRIPPPVTTTDAARLLWPVAEPGLVVEADDETYGLALALPDIEAQRKKLEKDEDEIKARIQAFMQNAEALTIGGKQRFTWKQKKTNSFDREGLRAALPDIEARFARSGVTREFRAIKEKQKVA